MACKERHCEAQRLAEELRDIQDRTRIAYERDSEGSRLQELAALRLRLTAVEHRLSLLRLLQAEDRLQQNLWRFGLGAGGVMLGWLLRSGGVA